MTYFTAFINDDVLVTICKVLRLPKDMKIIILDNIIDYIIEEEHARAHEYDYWDDNFDTGYPDYDSDWYYSD